MAQESYIYYELNQEKKRIEGYCDKDFKMDDILSGFGVQTKVSTELTQVLGYSFSGFKAAGGSGGAAKSGGSATTSMTVSQAMDVTIVPLLKAFHNNKLLNVALLLTSQGLTNRSKEDKKVEDDLHHFFTFMLARANIVDLDISRRGDDLVTLSFEYEGLYFQDHDINDMGETMWKDPTAKRTMFSEIWDKRK